MIEELSVQDLFARKGKSWEMVLIAGEKGLNKKITSGELNRPGLALAGYFDTFRSIEFKYLA